MSDTSIPSTFQVCTSADPLVVRINGKANYLNCNAFREFIDTMMNERKNRFVVEFTKCKGMDSTFLGILAGCALKLRSQEPPGALVLNNLSERNRELICNLGLQNLLTIAGDLESHDCENFQQLDESQVTCAKEMLEAHQSLVEAEKANAAKFQDVITYLQNQVDAE